LIGGALIAHALLAAHLFLGVAAVTIYMIWVLAIDGPHVFATLLTHVSRRRGARRPRNATPRQPGFFAVGRRRSGCPCLPVGGFLTISF